MKVISSSCFNEFGEKIECYKLSPDYQKLEKKQLLLDNIRKDSITLNSLNNDPEAIEEFAREKFLMKKQNEDIFIIREKTDE